MNEQNILYAASYVTTVAAAELTILQWVSLINGAYPDSIPENATFGGVINHYLASFPDFINRAQDNSQNALDDLANDVIKYMLDKLQN